MNALDAIRLALALGGIAAAYTKKTSDDKLIAESAAALEALQRWHDTAVTKENLEQLRTTIQWPDIE